MQNSKPLKILVVDDTVVYRKIVSDVITELPDAEVVGTAHNGKVAMQKINTLKPDLLTLDIEMPEMNGLQVLEKLQAETPPVGAIMLSTLTTEGGAMTMRALELGAFDFLPKPQSGTMIDNKAAIKKSLAPMLKAFKRNRDIRDALTLKSPLSGKPIEKPVRRPVPSRTAKISRQRGVASIIGIGISTGGPNALARMLPQLPGDIDVPIVIVQHMPPPFTQSLAKSLNLVSFSYRVP